MARIRGRDTAPELRLRRLLHGMGYRFRCCRADLPGRPDLVFAARRKVVFVHGCFWHRHPGCGQATLPRTRVAFWRAKFAANRTRDRRARRALNRAGWGVAVVWECALRRDEGRVGRRLAAFLGPPGDPDGGGRRPRQPHRPANVRAPAPAGRREAGAAPCGWRTNARA